MPYPLVNFALNLRVFPLVDLVVPNGAILKRQKWASFIVFIDGYQQIHPPKKVSKIDKNVAQNAHLAGKGVCWRSTNHIAAALKMPVWQE